ncbi:bifunctional DNA primase/polymerase [Lentzea sp. BCCO 10_0798]|uniref:Bifunctional DNA primase/polymerase n=1 Tax=Lentzea kristufekii TaxID=3095430 RepID=A0ABU4TJT8_9PSEU|nr:bifunctional DNA primase/polymerase [Lentzea sp. BCCO 10_0798]MDX8048505.1 bifunctional DNA primase/polymerase [Lentzea sp. BCCO 10_0798]
MSETNMLLFHALHYARLGMCVFPLRVGTKVPALHGDSPRRPCPRTGVCRNGHLGWEQRATTDPDRITACWSAAPFNIGIATGPSNLLVIDLDTRKSPDDVPPQRWNREGIVDGHDVFAAICEEAGEPVPWETFTAHTPSGGTHYYYKAPSTVELRNTTGDAGNGLGWKVDTRAHGGYVVGPWSSTPAGEYWAEDDAMPIDLPTWLVHCLTPRPPAARTAPIVSRSERLPGYVAAAVRGERDRVAGAQSGAHTRTLFVASVALGQLVGGGLLPSATAEAELFNAALHMITDRCGCTEAEVLRTIANGLRAGGSRPRKAPAEHAPATTEELFTDRGAA